jgi:peptidoglycan/xylan/chitin deacetylase (PgdA/CDA1 family)
VRPDWTVRPGPWPRPAAAPGLLGQRPSADDPPLIHLGFDVEGDPYHVEALLDVLDQRQVRTTMFIQGAWADANPEWTQEMARRGHEIASHTYSHADLSAMEATAVQQELRSTELTLQALTGQSPRPWLRPPFGSYSETSLRAAYEAGYTSVIWSGSANDWRSGIDADGMCAALRYYTAPGAILYAHTNRAAIVTAVDRFIAEAQAEGYTFVPLSVLMAEDPTIWLEKEESGD